MIFMDAEYSCRGGEVVRGVNKARAFLSEQEELVTLSPDQRINLVLCKSSIGHKSSWSIC